MRHFLTMSFVAAAVLIVVPGWSGEARLSLLANHPAMTATRVALDPHDARRMQVGGLTFLGGISLNSADPAFGGFSSLAVRGAANGQRFTLLSDGGNIVDFTMDARWRIGTVRFANVPGGPGAGWQKADRDSESMAVEPSGAILVGFESANAFWRYAPDFTRVERQVAPRAMAAWPVNGGPETLFRRADGSFVTISETSRPPRGGGREALVFAGDPTLGARAYRFVFVPPRRYDPADATELPDGRVVVLTRSFSLPYRFSNRLVLIDEGAIHKGARVEGRVIATLDAPLIHDNFEGIAVTRENGATILWLVSDDNQSMLQRSLLLKFRLDV